MEQVPPCRSDFAPWNRKLLSVMQLPVRCWREIVTDVGHKPGREKTARYIADNVLDPAPAKGATYRFDHGNSELTGFNPRTRKGCDSQPTVVRVFFKSVSIHAPVKGATLSFQSQARKFWFQSTHP